ncbi:SulP family inorganic anion transporter [Tropicimonas aquimaris]|uniref:SulP family inorganic anion transporter n=1 Tax=Tropicimonas aquimaris TaxID=914152 RepID=A0ABW3IWC6_9RHOB
MAGLGGSSVVLPKFLGHTTVAAPPFSVGLHTTFVPMLVYALIGSSRVLGVASTTSLAMPVGTQPGLAIPNARSGLPVYVEDPMTPTRVEGGVSPKPRQVRRTR